MVAIPGVIIGASVSPALMRKFDRKPVLIAAPRGLLDRLILAKRLAGLRLLSLMQVNESKLLLPLLLLIGLLVAMCTATGARTTMSLLDDIKGENELLIGYRQEGLIYSTRALRQLSSF
jgi:GPH family glycoside/pentoside/hexuronide:cation symporter